jgi:hypothetical protein
VDFFGRFSGILGFLYIQDRGPPFFLEWNTYILYHLGHFSFFVGLESELRASLAGALPLKSCP